MTVENIAGVGSSAIQWMHVRSGAQPIGTVIVTSIMGGGSTITGSVQATVQGSVWVANAGSLFATVAGSFSGTVVASVVGQATVTASCVGQQFVTASLIGQPTVQASVVGQLTVTASVAGIPTVVGSVLASQGAAPWTFTGSVQATQATSPWVTLAGSTGQPQGTMIVSSIMGGGLTVTGSVVATQGAAPWTFTGSVQATQATSPWVVMAGSTGQPQGTIQASVTGQLFATASLVGQPTVQASVVGQLTVTASIVGQQTVTASLIGFPTFVGSVQASQQGAWTFTGSVQATQATSPWVVMAGSTGQPQGTIQASVTGQLFVTASLIGQPTVQASVAGQVTVTASCVGQQFVTASLVGIPTFVGSVVATQGGVNWAVVGSVQVTQATSPWVVLAGSTGQPQGTIVASLFGQTFVTASLVGQATVQASCVGQQTVTASLIGIPTVVGSVIVTQGASLFVFEGGGTWITAIGSTTQGAGIVSVAASITSPASIQGGALNVRQFASHRGTANLFSSQLFSRGGADFTMSVSAVVAGVDMYESFILYIGLTKSNTPTDMRIRPKWTDGVTATSYFDMGQGFWTDLRVSDDVILASSLFQRTYVGPVLGPSVAFTFEGNTNTGSGSMVLDAWVEFVTTAKWQGT